MQEQDQLAPDPEELAKLERWLDIQPILDEVVTEREAQIEQWKDGDLPLGFGAHEHQVAADHYKRLCDEANARGDITLADILLEEVYEALAETNEDAARDELIQVAAVAIKAVQQIDRNKAKQAAADASA